MAEEWQRLCASPSGPSNYAEGGAMESKKLFFYELEGRGYIFQNKKWDETKHGFEDDMLNMAWEMWSSGQATKAQAVPEGFVLVSREMPKSFDEGLYVYSNSISIIDECSDGFIPMSDINHAEVWKLVIEAQEQVG